MIYKKEIPAFAGMTLIILAFIILYSVGVFASDNYVADTFANLTKKIAIHAGVEDSVWESNDRALITGGVVNMTAVGDGTWQYTAYLDPGGEYNYMFEVETGETAPAGLSDSTTYYDAVGTTGDIDAGTSPYEANLSNVAYYSRVGDNNDARRVLHVPKSLSIGTDTLYIFNNFGGDPQALVNFSAMGNSETEVKIVWDDPVNSWGSSESYKAVDVIGGGTITLYRSTGMAGPFVPVADIDGSNNYYIDSGLTVNTTYYYLGYVGDAYLGSSTETFAKGMHYADTSETAPGVPRTPIKVIFIIQNPDWDYINNNSRVVYATPYENRNNPYSKKIKCTITRAYLRSRKF